MKKAIIFFVLLAASLSVQAQWETQKSVLSEGSWYKIGVVENGVYAIDVALLQSIGVKSDPINPSRIRLFGNPAGVLPERNSTPRYDDLSELAIMVTGAEDGAFDGEDRILFYGEGPVKMSLSATNAYSYTRNPYTDTTYYFLCVDGEEDGLRVTEQASVDAAGGAVVDDFLDYWYHESEEVSPYASGRTWYGDMITTQTGFAEFHLDMPYSVHSKPVRFYTKLLGRCSSPFAYSLSLNGSYLVDGDTINKYSQYQFGREREVDRTLTINGDGFTVRYSLLPTAQQPLLYIDYFVLNYWRELVFQEHSLAFGIIPAQYAGNKAEVRLRGLHAGLTCWEVTDPLHPCAQQMSVAEGIGSFGIEGPAERHFLLFEESGVKEVASAYAIPNQNLHALTTADFLIVTHELFREQAEALADFHREADQMECLVVDIREIYNEFATGAADPTALRDFIRMIYLRSGEQLKYVLLMGKGTHDYRNIKGQNNNYVPTYETLALPWSQTDSKCTDDYFALMGASEGQDCAGLVDIGVGRLPVTTAEQAAGLVQKIMHYADRSVTHGPWLNTHLFLADNDSESYIDYPEYLDRLLDTACHPVTTQKLYVDSYPIVNTPMGSRIPEAHDALLDYFEKGFAALSYTGHGGVTNLMNEQVLTFSDIQAMRNFDRLPFVHTATCEFSEYDNPLRVSAGEMMILNPQGGAIAMLTTSRPTFPGTNQSMSSAIHQNLYDKEGSEQMRFGDIIRRTKNTNYVMANICYVFFGDPALRFAYPPDEVSVTSVNGSVPQNITVPASSLVSLEACIAGNNQRIDTLFNGVVDVKVYDKKSRFTTLGALTAVKNYSYYHDVLFEGKVEVVRGAFSVTFPVPSNINFGDGNARVILYAYDTIRERTASGTFEMLHLEGTDPSQPQDHQGPEVDFYWDVPTFVSGDVVSRNGTLYADLFDEQGIYHYNVSIGRDILLRSDVGEFDNVVLTDRFEPAMNDYRRGRIVIPINGLESGVHEFTLKVWDTQDNSTEKTIVLIIEDGLMLAQVYNYPNPFEDETYFSFKHGDMTEALRVRVEVFDVLGRRLTDFVTSTNSNAGVVPPIRWDGRDAYGHRLSPGVYVYRLNIEDEKGHQRAATGRLMIR